MNGASNSDNFLFQERMKNVEPALDKFLRYVKIDTQSKEDSDTYPSTLKQFDLANLLLKELKDMGLTNATLDEYCYVMASIPSNIPETNPAYRKVPAIGFVAHVDTSPEVTGANVKPQVIKYEGGDIILPGNPDIVIKEAEDKGLQKCKGHTIVTTDGTTLLGADNKSGVAAIMTMAEFILKNPDIIHGDIKICFTPDEEVGQGTKHIDLEKFGAKYAYTIDGELPGELNKETFSANLAVVTVHGRDIHPGSAKNVMVNSIRVASEVIARTPRHKSPETTEGYEPYIHPYSFEGSIAKSVIKMLFRDFRTLGLDELKRILEDIVDEVRYLYPAAKIEVEVKEQYRNMLDKLEEVPLVLDCLWEAAVRAGTEPYWSPIRGGTDGSKLTEMGLPTPNIYTGAQNFHSSREWLSVDFMNKSIETIINLIQVWVEKSRT